MLRWWKLPYWFLSHQQDVLPQYFQLYSFQIDCWGSVWWVSMCRENYKYDIDRNKLIITVLVFKASARYCISSSLNWLLSRFRVVSVYVTRRVRICKRDENWMRITTLILKTSARCLIPSVLIWFQWRFSVVSVYV
jgi:hypothetical protein